MRALPDSWHAQFLVGVCVALSVGLRCVPKLKLPEAARMPGLQVCKFGLWFLVCLPPRPGPLISGPGIDK